MRVTRGLGQPKGHLQVILLGAQPLLCVYSGKEGSRAHKEGWILGGKATVACSPEPLGSDGHQPCSGLQSRVWVQLLLFGGVFPITLEIQSMGCMDQEHMWAAKSGREPPRLRVAY